MRKPRFKRDAFAALRKRILRETEIALMIGLRFPEKMPRIPTIEVGKGTFHSTFAEEYWKETLDLDEADIERLQHVTPVEWLPDYQQ
ncbi:MAG: hypothetical protein JSU63_16700 [Phycisphaerales bacterium]|nr:MAG: hypothetical protein JSU63_16700 [Phycisphaerales bacterium]